MIKLPPIEKIYEAFTAFADGRVTLEDDTAHVVSSDGAKVYTVKWEGGVYHSDDNATYWQGYAGYPVIAVLLLRGLLPLDRSILPLLAGINWHELNKKYRRDYARAFDQAVWSLTETEKARVVAAAEEVYVALAALDISVARKSKT